MIDLLVYVLILCLVLGVIIWVIRLLPLPEPLGTLAFAVVGLIFFVILLSILLSGVPMARFR